MSNDEENDWPYWRIKLIAVIMLGIITSYHIYSSRLAVVINQTFAVIKLMILSSIAIAGLVKLPSILKENPNNWSNFEYTGLTEGFEDFSVSFVLVCNLI